MKYVFLIFSIPVFLLFVTPKSPSENTEVLADVNPKNEAIFPATALVQLFTSQGCSSCPPADALLEKIKTEYDNVYVLSYHVDYWNRLGWKDPFSKAEYTDLQYQYGKKFRSGSVYTPQAVINGNEHFVGSNKGKMKDRLTQYLKQKDENKVVLKSSTLVNSALSFLFSVDGDTEGKTLKAALVLDKETTYVSRGENRKRTLENSNIVIDEVDLVIPKVKSGEASIQIPDWVDPSTSLRLIAYIQDENLAVYGAAQLVDIKR